MSAIKIKPFNNQPKSFSIKTSTYVIPVGKYARVTPISITCTFNGQEFGASSSTFSSLAAVGMCSNEFTGRITAGALIYGGNSRVISLYQGGSPNPNVYLENGTIHYFTNGNRVNNVSISSVYTYGYIFNNTYSIRPIYRPTFFCNAGDSLSGPTGRFSWLVEEYDIIS